MACPTTSTTIKLAPFSSPKGLPSPLLLYLFPWLFIRCLFVLWAPLQLVQPPRPHHPGPRRRRRDRARAHPARSSPHDDVLQQRKHRGLPHHRAAAASSSAAHVSTPAGNPSRDTTSGFRARLAQPRGHLSNYPIIPVTSPQTTMTSSAAARKPRRHSSLVWRSWSRRSIAHAPIAAPMVLKSTSSTSL